MIRKNISGFGFPEFDEIMFYDFSFVFFIIFVLFSYEKIYKFRYDFWQDTLKVIYALTLGLLLTLSLLTLSKTNLEYSRVFILVYFILGIVIIPIAKRWTKKLIFSFDLFKIKTLIVGDYKQVEILKKEINDNFYLGQKYVQDNYESVIIISKGLKSEEINALIEKYLHNLSEVFIVPYVSNINFAHSNILEYPNIRTNTIQIENKLLVHKNIWIKEIFDKVISILILPFFLILHFIISLVIKLDSKGDILFKQHRLGKDDIDFKVYKYRTMRTNSDEILRKYLQSNTQEIKYYDKFHKYKNDPRITKIGKFLRSSSLDELPQIINVLKGDMSLVGPRPYMVSEKDKLSDNKKLILKVKPGITGLWQVSGRSSLSFKERNELEIWYIKNWSLWDDFIILIKTVKVILNKSGAK
jgi:undecaprenyl-phosphate galactose phosphotransferase